MAPWMSAPATASASMLVAGAPLDGSVQNASTIAVSVAAPSGVKSVKLVLDGVYIGQSNRFPYQFTIVAAAGTHRLDAHWNTPTEERVSARFAVAGPATAQAGGSRTNPRKHKAPGVPPSVNPPTTGPPSVAPPSIPGSSSPTDVGTIAVSSSAALSVALATALPGQTILLADGVYLGKFTASASGTANYPITLRGSRAAILTAGGVKKGYGLHITGSYWAVQGISVTQSGKGIVLDGSQHTVLSGVDVGFTGDEGVHFRRGSSYSSIISSSVHDTGLKAPGFGEGVYIGSAHSNWATVMGSASIPDKTDHVVVQGNKIYNTAAEGVDVKEGTTAGLLLGNVFTNAGYSGANSGDSWVDVKGNSYTISGNSGSGTKTDAFQVHQAVAGWGNNNVFSGNIVDSGVPGYLVNIGPRVTGTVVGCQSTHAWLGVANARCSV